MLQLRLSPNSLRIVPIFNLIHSHVIPIIPWNEKQLYLSSTSPASELRNSYRIPLNVLRLYLTKPATQFTQLRLVSWLKQSWGYYPCCKDISDYLRHKITFILSISWTARAFPYGSSQDLSNRATLYVLSRTVSSVNKETIR